MYSLAEGASVKVLYCSRDPKSSQECNFNEQVNFHTPLIVMQTDFYKAVKKQTTFAVGIPYL